MCLMVLYGFYRISLGFNRSFNQVFVLFFLVLLLAPHKRGLGLYPFPFSLCLLETSTWPLCPLIMLVETRMRMDFEFRRVIHTT